MPDFSKLDRPALHALIQEMVLDRAASVTVKQLADIERAAFRRGAEAMREAAARECWAVSDEMADRNDMLSEQGTAQSCATRIRVLRIAEDNP